MGAYDSIESLQATQIAPPSGTTKGWQTGPETLHCCEVALCGGTNGHSPDIESASTSRDDAADHTRQVHIFPRRKFIVRQTNSRPVRNPVASISSPPLALLFLDSSKPSQPIPTYLTLNPPTLCLPTVLLLSQSLLNQENPTPAPPSPQADS
ncbi:hypothetical protein BDV59DRAFT_180572 [Aspergillus ambiguus]|uniref:uncharacterized protein n=1 Tax=Aspergillus ambiguus TaxID=176160 RepID=UPI003CCD93F3